MSDTTKTEVKKEGESFHMTSDPAKQELISPIFLLSTDEQYYAYSVKDKKSYHPKNSKGMKNIRYPSSDLLYSTNFFFYNTCSDPKDPDKYESADIFLFFNGVKVSTMTSAVAQRLKSPGTVVFSNEPLIWAHKNVVVTEDLFKVYQVAMSRSYKGPVVYLKGSCLSVPKKEKHSDLIPYLQYEQNSKVLRTSEGILPVLSYKSISSYSQLVEALPQISRDLTLTYSLNLVFS